MCGVFVLGLVTARPLTDASVRQRFLELTTVSAGMYAAVALLLLVAASMSEQLFLPWNVLPGFDNIRFLNHAQTIVLPLVGIVLVSPTTPGWLRRVAAFTLFMGGGILALYLSRASVLGLLIGSVATAVLVGRDSRRYLVGVCVCVIAGMVAMGLAWYFWLSALTTRMTQDLGTSHYRDYLAGLALDMVTHSPWWGIGPMHFSHTVNPIAAHPHNFYVQLLAELGLPASLLMGFFLVRGLIHAKRLLPFVMSESPALASGLTVGTVAVLVDACFSGNFVMPISQMWIAMLLALLLGLYRERHRKSMEPMGSPALSWWPRALVAGAMIAAAVPAAQESVETGTIHIDTGEPMKAAIGDQGLNPRFWAHGWF